MKRLLIFTMVFLLCGILCSVLCHADGGDPETIFRTANQFYESGEYDKAITEYQKILDSGYESASIYYNLGNAYFKSGDDAEALVNYERARRLDPGDSDLISNYKFVRAGIQTPLITPRGIWNWKVVKEYLEKVTVDAMFIISSALYAVAMIFLIGGVYMRRFMRRFALVAMLLLVCACGNLFIAFHAAGEIGTRAVVMEPQTESYYGPFDSATVFFKLHRGNEVKVLKKNDDWYKVRRADGKSGWVKASAIEII